MQTLWRDSGDEAAYESARLKNVFNLRRPTHRPLAAIQATCAADVLKGVELARSQKCQVAVRSGGHSIPVWSLHPDSILIDLGNWKETEVNPGARIAIATPSITSKELNSALATHGLMFPGGHCPDVGLGGFMLQGGMGWNSRNWGWACESLQAVEVVTAQGESLLCNAQQNQDLYWAARGAGPAFPGIVTKFHLQLMPAPSEGLRSSGYIYSHTHYRTVFDWVLSLVSKTDYQTEVVMVAFHPEHQDNLHFMVFIVSMESTVTKAEQVLQEVHQSRPSGATTEWLCQPESLDNLYSNQNKANPQSHYYSTDDAFLYNQADVSAALEKAFCTLPPGKSSAFWYPMYPRSRRPLPDMALGVQSDHYFCIYAICEDEGGTSKYKAWVQEAMAEVRQSSVGAYIGESDCNMPGSWYWGHRNVRRLVEVLQKWDPDGVFAAASQCIEL